MTDHRSSLLDNTLDSLIQEDSELVNKSNRPYLGLDYSYYESRASTESCVAWGTQATMDYKITVNENELKLIAGYLLKNGFIEEKFESKLKSISQNGLDTDTEATLSGLVVQEEITKFKQGIRQDIGILEQKTIKEELGGSPAISAKAGKFAEEIFGNCTVRYWGLKPRSVDRHIIENGLEDLFKDSVIIEKYPSTLAFECGKYKLMLSDEDGRLLKELKKNNPRFQINIPRSGNTLVAIGGLNKGTPTEYSELVDRIKGINPDANVFIGTNSFKKYIESRQYGTIDQFKCVLRKADIVSMNEAELDDLHEAQKRIKYDYSRTKKLEELGFDGIAIVHCHAGASIYIGEKISLNAAELIQSMVKTASYATSFFIECGRHANTKKELEEYYISKCGIEDIEGCNKELAPLEGGARIRSIKGTYVPPLNRKGNITGAGAMFDGYLCSLLAPHLESIKNGKI